MGFQQRIYVPCFAGKYGSFDEFWREEMRSKAIRGIRAGFNHMDQPVEDRGLRHAIEAELLKQLYVSTSIDFEPSGLYGFLVDFRQEGDKFTVTKKINRLEDNGNIPEVQ